MSLKALISMSRAPHKVDSDGDVAKRLVKARRSLDEYDRQVEVRIAAKVVTREQLAKTCSL